MSEIGLRIGAILLLVVGALYPMMAMVGLVRRLNRPDAPAPTPFEIMVHLFLIATVPIAGILGGFAGLLPAMWQNTILRLMVLTTGAASLAGFVILFIISRMERSVPDRAPDETADETSSRESEQA